MQDRPGKHSTHRERDRGTSNSEDKAAIRENQFLRGLQAISARESLDPVGNLRAVQELTCEELGLDCAEVRVRAGPEDSSSFRVSSFGGAENSGLSDACWAELLDCQTPAGSSADGVSQLESDVGSGIAVAIGVALVIRNRGRGAVAFWSAEHRAPFLPGDAEIVAIAASHLSTLVHVQQELNRAMSAFRRIAPLCGNELFEQAAREASTLVRAPGAFIARRDQADPMHLRVTAAWRNGEPTAGFEYDARGTPCEVALGGKYSHVRERLGELFPNWAPQKEMCAESYIGVPIANWSGEVLGVLAVTDVQPMHRAVFQERLLSDVASRVCAGIERAEMDATLRASQERLEVAINAGGIAIWEVDLAKGTIQPSATAAALVGLTPEEAPTDFESWQSRLHPEDLERETARFQATSEDRRQEFAADLRIRHRDGSYRWVLFTGRVFGDGEKKASRLISAGVDITEKKRFEERLQQSQKMENLATLAGGIAHDFNNLLMSIGGNASMALRDGAAGRIAERMQQVSLATERAAELTRQMLVYAGRGATEPKVLGLGALVEEISGLLDTVISKKAQLELHCEDSPAVEADPAQLRQIVMNLLTNASDALESVVGRISVETGRRHLDRSTLAECLGAPDLKPGEYAFVQVSDTGGGMTPQTRLKMFDPFFTTKPTGRGLGMAVVIGAVTGHGGTIRVRTAIGEGSEITVFLPLTDKPLSPTDEATRSPDRAAKGGKVLIIEDEQMILELATSVLEEEGYEVVTAAGGHEGLARFAEHREALEAILLDVTMPDLSGLEVLARIRESDGDTPVILMSGYAESDFDGPSVPASAYLKKPFPIDTLIETLHSVRQPPSSRP